MWLFGVVGFWQGLSKPVACEMVAFEGWAEMQDSRFIMEVWALRIYTAYYQ